MLEKWKEVPNYETYEVSTLGRFRRKLSDGRYKYIGGGYVGSGYSMVQLYNKSGCKRCILARLVAELFIPNLNDGWIVRHKNSNIKDNRVENLYWVSPKRRIKRL